MAKISAINPTNKPVLLVPTALIHDYGMGVATWIAYINSFAQDLESWVSRQQNKIQIELGMSRDQLDLIRKQAREAGLVLERWNPEPGNRNRLSFKINYQKIAQTGGR